MSMLSGKIAVVNFVPGSVVWYTPEDFPTVQTDATWMGMENGKLQVHTGIELIEIAPVQVVRIETARQHEISEAADDMRDEYEREERA